MVIFNRSYLKQHPATLIPETTVNICIVYKISKNFNMEDYPTLENCLFGAVILGKIVTFISINILEMVLDLKEKKLSQ